MLGYDATQDMARHRTDDHYRLYFSKSDRQFVVINVQDFDYRDYDDRCFADYVAYDTQANADVALAQLKLAVWLVVRSWLA